MPANRRHRRKYYTDLIQLILGYIVGLGVLLYMFRPIPHGAASRVIFFSFFFIVCVVVASFRAVVSPPR